MQITRAPSNLDDSADVLGVLVNGGLPSAAGGLPYLRRCVAVGARR